jgi:hypothetical protein
MPTTGLAAILTLIAQLSPEEKRQRIEYVAPDSSVPQPHQYTCRGKTHVG